jgi:hypothetical protein
VPVRTLFPTTTDNKSVPIARRLQDHHSQSINRRPARLDNPTFALSKILNDGQSRKKKAGQFHPAGRKEQKHVVFVV